MPAIDYWLPKWWDLPVSAVPYDTPAAGPQQQHGIVTAQSVVPDPPNPGQDFPDGGPPPAAGAATVEVDGEELARIRRIKKLKTRRRLDRY